MGEVKTLQQRIQEYEKCKNNPIYFIENYIKLPTPGRTQTMDLYEPQENFLNSILTRHYVIALKSRQIGFSTITQAYITYCFTFFNNVRAGIVSRQSEESTAFARKIHNMLSELPKWLCPQYQKKTEQTAVLDNGCELHASWVNQKNPESLFRGPSITIAVIDEAAHIDNIGEAWTGFGPSLVKSQTDADKNNIPYATIIISTPNKTVGTGKWFYDRWQQAHEEDSVYVPHKVHWSEVKEFREDPKWYKTQCQMLYNDPSLIAQELELKFIASSNSFLPPQTIEVLNDVSVEPKTKINLDTAQLWQWYPPDSQKYYLIGVDIASSSGSDFSTIEIFDYLTFEQVAEYKNKMRVDDFCNVISTICKLFPKHLIIPEHNSLGNQVVEFLTRSSESYNIYKPSDSDQKQRKWKCGISTDVHTRPLMIDSLYTYMTENPDLINSERLALELIALEKGKGGKIEASKGSHDDLAMATAFCCYVRLYDPPMSITTHSSQQVVNDVNKIIASNFDNEMIDLDPQGNINRQVQTKVKNNLFELTENSNEIDIMKFFEQNKND